MPILGVIASSTRQGQGPAGDTGSMIAISAVNVGSANAATVTFSNIPQTYKDLQIRIIGKTSETSYTGEDNFNMYINGDTTQTNYYNHWARAVGNSTNPAALQGSGYQAYLGTLATSGTGQDNMYSPAIIDILDYTMTNKYKTIKTINGDVVNSTNGGISGIYSSIWFSGSAITSITFTIPGGSAYKQYSSFALYGIKGA